jgi:hypothetical protein
VDISAVVVLDETTLQATVNPPPGGGNGEGGAAPVQSVSLSAPSGWNTSTTNTGGNVTLTLDLPTGFSLPSNTSQGNWNTAYAERLRWDGGSTGLNPATGRTSLGLGTLATQSGTFSGTSSGTNTGDNAINSLYSGLVSNANHTGDASGSTVLTLATVNANVGSFGSATVAPIVTVNGKGLVTAVSTATITPAVGSITGLGTGIATALAANVGTAGAPVVFGGVLGTPSSANLANATGLPLTNGVTGILPVANGGTGTASPGLVAGANVTITGAWPNQSIAVAGGGGGGGSGTVTSVGLVAPTGFSVSGSPVTVSGNITLAFAAGYSLPLNSSQANWNTAFTERLRWDGGSTGLNATTARTSLGLGSAATAASSDFATAAQGSLAATAVQPEVLSSYQPLDSDLTLIAALTTATFGRSLLTQADAAAARTTLGAGTSSLVVSSSAPQPLAAIASAGSTGQAADAGHVHQRDTDVLVVNLSGSASDPTAANTIETFRFPFAAEFLASELSSETAASGSAFQVNARLNASSIYSVRPQIAIGSTAGSSGTLAITAAAIGDVLRFDISQAGGGCRLAKLYLTIRRTA